MSRPGASWSSRVRRGCGDAHVARRVCPVTALGPPSPRPPYCASGKASTEAPRPLLSRRGTPIRKLFSVVSRGNQVCRLGGLGVTWRSR